MCPSPLQPIGLDPQCEYGLALFLHGFTWRAMPNELLRYNRHMNNTPNTTAFSMPILPGSNNHLTAKLLINPTTENKLAWSLMSTLNPQERIDGKSLLQLFCESHVNKSLAHRMPLGEGERLPASPSESWPDPKQGKDEWPSIGMWLAATLILNGPDPFDWKSETGHDILDYAVLWNNDHIFSQLLRMPGAPLASTLSDRLNFKKDNGWLHSAAAAIGGHIILKEMFNQGLDLETLNKKGTPVLHSCEQTDTLKVLIEAGVNLFSLNKEGHSAPLVWIEEASRNDNVMYKYKDMTQKWAEQALKVDPQQAETVATEAIFFAMKKNMHQIAKALSETFKRPLSSWKLKLDNKVWGAAGVSAINQLNKGLNNSSSGLSDLVKDANYEDLLHVSTRNLMDLDFVWAAALAKGMPSTSPRKSNHLYEKLVAKINLPNEQIEELFVSIAARMATQAPFKGKRTNTGIESALTEQAHYIADQMKGNSEVTHMYDYLQNNPSMLVGLINNKVSDSAFIKTLQGVPGLLRNASPEKKSEIFNTYISLVVKSIKDPNTKDIPMFPHFFEAIDTMLSDGARLNMNNPDMIEAMLTLESCVNPRARELAAQMEEAKLMGNTAEVNRSAERGKTMRL